MSKPCSGPGTRSPSEVRRNRVKESVAEAFWKNPPVSHQVRAHRSKEHTALTAPLVLHHTRIYKRAMKKIIFNGQKRNKHFLIVIYHSSLVKAAVNAVCVCKLSNGVKKRLNFFFFQWPKLDQVRNEYSPQLSKLLYNCKLKNKEAH